MSIPVLLHGFLTRSASGPDDSYALTAARVLIFLAIAGAAITLDSFRRRRGLRR